MNTRAALLTIGLMVAALTAGGARADCGLSCSGADPGHLARATSRWPYAEDIAHGGSSPSTPYGDVTVGYNNWNWTTIQSGCVDVNQTNVYASGTFHTLLRSQTTIVASSLPPGTLYESQLLLTQPGNPNFTDLVVSWDSRRLRGGGNGSFYRQIEHFAGILENVAAGTYSFQQRVRIIDNVAGSITLSNQYTTALGVPASEYPGAGSVYNGNVTIGTTWVPVGNVMTIPANDTALDITAVGTGKISSGTVGAAMEIGFSVDGQSSGSQYGHFAIPTYQPEGFTAIDYKVNVSANQSHTLQMWMHTTSGNATIELPTLAYLGYANAKAENLALDEAEIRTTYSAIDATTTKRIGTDSTDVNVNDQPLASNLCPTCCGYWTKLLEFDIPGGQQVNRANTALTTLITGYVQIVGNVTGTPYGELAITIDGYGYTPESPNTPVVTSIGEAGVSAVWAKDNDGVYFSTDGIFANFGHHNHVALWMRKVTCGQGNGGFTVSKRYMSMKFLPAPHC